MTIDEIMNMPIKDIFVKCDNVFIHKSTHKMQYDIVADDGRLRIDIITGSLHIQGKKGDEVTQIQVETLLKYTDMTQAKIATLVGVSQPTVSLIKAKLTK